MNKQLPSESAENTRQIDIDATIHFERHRSRRRMRELEAARRCAEEVEEAASRSASECNALLAMGIGILLGGFFFGGE